jgi:hypothetical protein
MRADCRRCCVRIAAAVACGLPPLMMLMLGSSAGCLLSSSFAKACHCAGFGANQPVATEIAANLHLSRVKLLCIIDLMAITCTFAGFCANPCRFVSEACRFAGFYMLTVPLL